MVCPLSSEVISHILWLIQRKPYAVYSRSLCFRVKGTLILKTKTNKNPKLKQNKRKRNYTNQNPQAKKVIKFNDGAFSTKTPQILHNNHKSCITTPPPQQLSVHCVKDSEAPYKLVICQSVSYNRPNEEVFCFKFLRI